MLERLFLLLALVALMLAAGFAVRWLAARSRVQKRWYERTAAAVAGTGGEHNLDERSWLGRWLYLAGYRNSWAPTVFLTWTVVAFLCGLSLAIGVRTSGVQSLMEQNILLVPGGVGDLFLPVVWTAPWLSLVLLTCLPLLVVRRERRRRIEMIEEDLPLALELVSTLSEAGLGFDAAWSRILKTRLVGRPLAGEMQMFQADLLAGRPRVECLRRLSSRIEIASMSIFVSALVQAEQLGMGIARVLRQQADDVRSRRRERAMAFANALPVKRLFPLVICFLPGLFVWTLGPAFVQLFKMAEAFVSVRKY